MEMAAQLSQSNLQAHETCEGGNYNEKMQINNISWKCCMITQELTIFRILFSKESVKHILYILWYFKRMTQYDENS